MSAGEFERIHWLKSLTDRTRAGPGRVLRGIGDDAAVLKIPDGLAAVLTVDTQVEGIHFRPGWITPAELGARAVAVSASDLAAMAARPLGILLAIALPASASENFFRSLYRGSLREASRLKLTVLGGNLSAGQLAVTVTSIGAVQPGREVGRWGSRAGDGIYVTGWPGRSRLGREVLTKTLAAGRRDRRNAATSACLRAFKAPRARLPEARFIARRLQPRAMVDLSDGLAPDLGHVLAASRVSRGRQKLGASLDLERIASLLGEKGCRRLASHLKMDLLGSALWGGEDYELLFTAPPGPPERAAGSFRKLFGVPMTRVGTVETRPGVKGKEGREIDVGGHDHFPAG